MPRAMGAQQIHFTHSKVMPCDGTLMRQACSVLHCLPRPLHWAQSNMIVAVGEGTASAFARVDRFTS